ncbi:ETEC_3214 domain-containing protein [Actinosynnema sp.]|uniref:ETEC_3214 domain-containing protein n=1 Tax=Actinosynnema sp. TaxID=1872144 RepID=UPI003F853F9E
MFAAIWFYQDAQKTADEVFWRKPAYERLGSIHAGYTQEYVKQVLGQPASVQPIRGTEFTESVFQGRDHWAKTISDADGRVALFSVTSCDEEFRPTFDIGNAVIQLQAGTIASAISPDPDARDPQSGFHSGIRTIDWRAGATGGSPEQYLEWSGPSSTASGLRAYFVGINTRMCADNIPREMLPSSETYSADASQAPPRIARFRQAVSANSYAETIYPILPALDPSFGMLDFAHPNAPDCDASWSCASVLVTAFDLPPGATTGTTHYER